MTSKKSDSTKIFYEMIEDIPNSLINHFSFFKSNLNEIDLKFCWLKSPNKQN